MRISDWSFRRVLFRSRNTLAALSEFEDLNDAVRPTGGVVNKVSNWFKDALGNDELSRMEQLSLGMARGMRQPGEGAVSDFEGKLFAKMAGGYNRPYGTNVAFAQRSEEHTSELQSLMRISYAVFCLKKKKYNERY